MRLPIISHHEPSPTLSLQIHAAVQLAERLVREKTSLRVSDQFAAVTCKQLNDAPALHLDDYSEIPTLGRERHVSYMQQRACLRAASGDWVVTATAYDPAFTDYFEQQLQLGPINWLVAASDAGPRKLALSCIRSRSARRELSHAVRQQSLRYIHPHHASVDVWRLAAWLHEFTRMPIQVVGPPTEVCRFANDKAEFSELIEQLLGREFVPRTAGAFNLATLSSAIRDLAKKNSAMAVKLPHGTGGHGNIFVDALAIRGRTLQQIHDYLLQRLELVGIPTGDKLLVDVWERDVLKNASVQTWIPPRAVGSPVIEGLFEQHVGGPQGNFLGSRPLVTPDALTQQIVDQSYLLTIVLQHLGYVGRCSFDFILVGDALNDCRVEFIECNGRWGGTSAPMTFVNRLMGDYVEAGSFQTGRGWNARYFVMPFGQIADSFGDQLYDARTGCGHMALFNPARAEILSEIEFVRWGASDVQQLSQIGTEGRLDAGEHVTRVLGRKQESDPAAILTPPDVGADPKPLE